MKEANGPPNRPQNAEQSGNEARIGFTAVRLLSACHDGGCRMSRSDVWCKVVNFDVSPHRRLTGEIIGEIISPVKKLVKFISLISTHFGTFCVATVSQNALFITYANISW